jgi:hypothetical protein
LQTAPLPFPDDRGTDSNATLIRAQLRDIVDSRVTNPRHHAENLLRKRRLST